jgi:transposase
VKAVPVDKLVSVDESGATTSMTRLWGRAPKGQRVIGSVPGSHWQVTTILGALRAQGMVAAMTIPAATDAEVFRAFLKQVLVPALHPGEVVLLDNLSSHKVVGVQELIESAGARVLYLPPYSPDFNPIEPCWSKVKAHLRATAARTQDQLDVAIAHALEAITPADGKGFFRKCGYIVH